MTNANACQTNAPLNAKQMHAVHCVQAGQEYIMALRANTGTGMLTSLDALVTFDSSLLEATGCEPGSGIVSESDWECRFNIAGLTDEVQVSYTYSGAESDQKIGTGVECAVITFNVRPLISGR